MAKGLDLAVTVYRATDHFPKEERYGLTSQARSCAASIPANVAEGRGRQTPKDFLHFVAIAIGSLNELETYLTLAERLGLMQFTVELQEQCGQVGRLLHGLRNSLQRRGAKA